LFLKRNQVVLNIKW